MAADCAIELSDHNITMISLWPEGVKTENVVKEVLLNEEVSHFTIHLPSDHEYFLWVFQLQRHHRQPCHNATHVYRIETCIEMIKL